MLEAVLAAIKQSETDSWIYLLPLLHSLSERDKMDRQGDDYRSDRWWGVTDWGNISRGYLSSTGSSTGNLPDIISKVNLLKQETRKMEQLQRELADKDSKAEQEK